MSNRPIYSAATGKIVNAYMESVTERAIAIATGKPYNETGHAKVAADFDALMTRLDHADDLLDYLSDAADNHGVVLRISHGPEHWGSDADRMVVIEVRQWGDDDHETARDALERDWRKNATVNQQPAQSRPYVGDAS